LRLPIDVQIQLFHSMVLNPIALYGCEIWGFEHCGMIERLHLKFCTGKYVLRIKTSTPTFMVYGELGEYPVNIMVKSRMINFWLKLVNGKQSKYSTIMYHILLFKYLNGTVQSKWLVYMSKRLKDQFIQSWYELLHKSEKGYNYRIFKTKFEFEHYLNVLPFPLWNQLCRFRVCNHNLPVEVGRFNNLPRYMRTCHCCNSDQLGDEYYFLFE
jgi:hypothetical protein